MTFDELTDEDKNTIYNWAVNVESTRFIKGHIMNLFNEYAKNDTNLEWTPEIVNPLWFRIQSIGSMLHSDVPYVLTHTNLLRKISGQKILITGIDMKDKEGFIGKKSHYLQQKLMNNNNNNSRNQNCPLCSYRYKQGDDESKQQKEYNENDDTDTFCEQCCDSNFGLYTVWTALDYFDTPFNAGSMLFCLGSHNKYGGYYKATINNEAVPKGYSNKSISDKQKLCWGYVNDIKPGDQFIFNVKTLHCSPEAKDGFLRARIDMRVALKPSMKRYIQQLNEAKLLINEKTQQKETNELSRLGLSQLCPSNTNTDLPPQSQPLTITQTESNSNTSSELKEKDDIYGKQTINNLNENTNNDQSTATTKQISNIESIASSANNNNNNNQNNEQNIVQSSSIESRSRTLTPQDADIDEDDENIVTTHNNNNNNSKDESPMTKPSEKVPS